MALITCEQQEAAVRAPADRVAMSAAELEGRLPLADGHAKGRGWRKEGGGG